MLFQGNELSKGGIHFNAAYLKNLRPLLAPRQAAYMLQGQS